MDPVPRSFGYKFNKQRGDIVTLSHDHPGHTATEIVSSDYKLIDGPGEYEINEVFITGIQTYHDDVQGALHGRNTVYIVEVEGMTICHLGDLGHELTDEQSEAMDSVDILIVPVGGGTVLDAARASVVAGQIEPAMIIPVQYRTEYGDHEREDAQRFLREMAAGEVQSVDKLTVRSSNFSGTIETEVVLLECSATRR